MVYRHLGVVLCWLVAVCAETQHGPFDNLLNFLSMKSGYFEEGETKDVCITGGEVSAMSIPVYVPAFSGALALLITVMVNSSVERDQLLRVTEDGQGLIHAQPYNFVNPRSNPGSQDTDFVAELTLKDLTDLGPECEKVFRREEDSGFKGRYPDCMEMANGTIPIMNGTITCDYFRYVMEESQKESVEKKAAYRCQRFSLPSPWNEGATFENVCEHGH